MRQLNFFLLLAFLSLNINAQNTYVPDDNFEQALIDLGYDSGALNDYVPTANINVISWLDVRSKAISDLTGIEGFTSLMVLEVADNNLTSLDVSNNTSLTNIVCYSNSLTSIDVSNNTSLLHLLCYTNSLTSLDVSNNTNLITLYANENNLTSLDLSNNTALANFSCNTNNLSSLDVSNNVALYYLSCHTNNLDRLNLVNNQSLEYLFCYNNELIGLNLKNGKNGYIIYFDSTSNPDLDCIQVDDPSYSAANWTNIDPASSYRRNCRYVATYGNRLQQELLIDSKINSFTDEKLSIYPNPVNNEFTISIQTDAMYSIVNMNGQKLQEGNLVMGENDLNVSKLQSGMYFLNVIKDGVSIQKKLIKQ